MNPTPKQKLVLDSDARTILFHGGQGKGATWLAGHFLTEPATNDISFGRALRVIPEREIYREAFCPRLKYRHILTVDHQFAELLRPHSFSRVFIDRAEEMPLRVLLHAISLAHPMGKTLIACHPGRFKHETQDTRRYLMDQFITPLKEGEASPEGIMHIHSSVLDNPYLLADHPDYEAKLKNIPTGIITGAWEA